MPDGDTTEREDQRGAVREARPAPKNIKPECQQDREGKGRPDANEIAVRHLPVEDAPREPRYPAVIGTRKSVRQIERAEGRAQQRCS
jgi:hypothetical protein